MSGCNTACVPYEYIYTAATATLPTSWIHSFAVASICMSFEAWIDFVLCWRDPQYGLTLSNLFISARYTMWWWMPSESKIRTIPSKLLYYTVWWITAFLLLLRCVALLLIFYGAHYSFYFSQVERLLQHSRHNMHTSNTSFKSLLRVGHWQIDTTRLISSSNCMYANSLRCVRNKHSNCVAVSDQPCCASPSLSMYWHKTTWERVCVFVVNEK